MPSISSTHPSLKSSAPSRSVTIVDGDVTLTMTQSQYRVMLRRKAQELAAQPQSHLDSQSSLPTPSPKASPPRG